MRKVVWRMAAGVALGLLLPMTAAAQTSGIAGEVKDTSGAVLPGVTVEVASPALIEKVRSATTDGAGRYSITNLRTGIYSVTFTLPGFNTVKREGVELTSDFTASINGEMKVGAIEETITVAATSPIVDVQSITTRTVMTREVMDALPTGRNIQAVGIMIPGTSLSVGGGGALSRDVGGSGQLQQSPLQYRGSGDTVQTIEGLRLNNLCASGQYSGVYWNDNSFQEVSYITGADSAEVGQGGMRVNMVPRDGGNTFKGVVFGNYAGEGFVSDNCDAPGVGQPCTRSNLSGDQTFNKTSNSLTNVSVAQKIWDFNPSIGGPILRDRLWFNYTFRHWGTNKTVADSFYDLVPGDPSKYQADLTRPALDDGHIVSNVGRIAWQIDQKDKIAVYHDNQRKYRNHWGIASTVPPDASAIQVTPTNFVHVTRWTRTQSNRLLFDAGISIYDQEYTELYQPDVTGQTDKVWDLDAIRNSRAYNILDNATGKNAGAWNAPADHFSLLRTYSGSASYVTGSHSFKFGTAVTTGNWRLTTDVHGRRAADHAERRRAGLGDAAAPDRSPQRHQGGHRHVCPGPLGAGPHDAEPRHPLRLVHRRNAARRSAGRPLQRRRSTSTTAPTARTTRRRAAPAPSRTGRTSRRASAWRTTCSATAGPRSRRAWRATSPAKRSPRRTRPTRSPRLVSRTRAPGAISTATVRRSTRTETFSWAS